MFFSIIVAIGNQNQIGLNNKIPWNVKDDLNNFKNITNNHTIIMGRKTYESIGKSLPNRTNIILTKNKNFIVDNCIILHSWNEIIEYCKNENEVFIIGGYEIYNYILNSDLPLQKMYISYIDYNSNADTFFPNFNKNDWKIIYEKHFKKDKNNEYNFKYIVLEKNN